eukprot:TRINITY_DN4132_c0_g1_i6.p1 TRINITY_DN4132_c0_g1~~TRINITY_DN4132_c0_g1_i6.p1  ORF type:complete len:1033 (+),score=314.81 TRINITY_DN4132_c0_g1_i6:90-3188(+)
MLLSSIEAKDDRGETPMHWAAGIGCKKAAQILYDHGAAINIPNLSGESPLYKAAGNGRADVASFLMENEANVNHVTKRGKTPLIEASHFGYTDIVEELLDHGADVTIIDKVQKTALYYAAAKGRERVVELLIVKGGADIKSLNQNMLRSAIDKHQMVIAMYLVDAGAVVDKHVTNSLEDMNNDRNSAEFAIRFAKAFKVKYAAALKDLHKLQQQVKEKNVLSPFVTNVYPKPDKDDEEIKQKFRPLFDRFYSRQELESASLFLGFVISKIAKVRREYHNAPNIETKRVKQEVLRSLCWSAKTILDVSLTVPDELMIPYRYLYKDESSKIEHQLEWELLSRPAYRNEELTLLSDIVAASIDILIQHAHVQRILQYKWKEEAVIPFTENLQLLKNNRIIRSVMYGRRILFVVNLLIFCTFVGIITTIALMSSNNNDGMMFQLNQKLQVSWSDAAVQQVQSKEDLYAWMSGPMIDGIESLKGRNQILSPVRLRQVRVKTHPCKLYEDITPDCYRSWSSDDEDTATFGTNKTFSYTESSGNMFSGLNSISYRDDGGFITEIDPMWNRTDLEEVVQDLENSDWIDENTAAVFVEFVVWTANLERFAVGRIMVETLKAGSFDTWTTFDLVDLQPYDGSAGKNLKALHIAFLFLCLYYIVSEVQQMIRFKRTYLRDRWNFFDMIVIAVFLVCIGLTVWVIFAKRSVNFDGSSNFPDFVWLVETENIQKSLIAFLAIIVWFNLLRYMRAFRDVGVLFRVMTKMAGDVAIFLTIFLVFVVSFALAFHMLVGSKIHEFRSWGYAIMTLIRVIVGDFEWEHIEESNLAFVRVLFFAYLVIVPILLINLLIAMLNKSYSDVVERAVSEYELEFASIVLGYGFERTRTGKKKKDPEDEIELNVLTGSTTSLLNSADSLKNSAEINQSGNLQKSDGLSQSTTGDASLDLETPHISRKGELNNSATTDVTDAHPMDEEKTELQEVLEALKLMKESNEALNEKIKSMKKEMEESLDAKFKELHVQITEMRKEVVKDEIDFVYSNSNLF